MDNDKFERLAKEFYNETGMLPPGKDDALGVYSYDMRAECWSIWRKGHAKVEALEGAATQYMTAVELAIEVHPFKIDGTRLKALLTGGEKDGHN